MKYVSDDGKEFKTEDECVKYESQINGRKKKREMEDSYARIQNDVLLTNKEIDTYHELGGERLILSTNVRGHLIVNKESDYGYKFF